MKVIFFIKLKIIYYFSYIYSNTDFSTFIDVSILMWVNLQLLFILVYFVCRRGNDSQIAAKELQKKWSSLYGFSDIPIIRDITNGLHQWSKTVDNNFPIY